MDGIGNIQIHDSQWIRQADLDMKHLVVKGIALQPPTFDHGRTHPVEVPCAGRGFARGSSAQTAECRRRRSR